MRLDAEAHRDLGSIAELPVKRRWLACTDRIQEQASERWRWRRFDLQNGLDCQTFGAVRQDLLEVSVAGRSF